MRLRWGTFGTNFQTSTLDAWQAGQKMATGSSPINFNAAINDFLQITGVQVEIGSVTDFEHRSFGQELASCHRYCYVLDMAANRFVESGFSFSQSATVARHIIQLPVPMRTNPTFTGTATAVRFYAQDIGDNFNANTFVFSATPVKDNCLGVSLYGATTGMTGGQGGIIQAMADGSMTFDSEL